MAKVDLTDGKISSKLFKLAIPIILTGFMETTYNLVDMFWIGKLGTAEVAAVGTAGFYAWLSVAFMLLARAGTEINVAQKTGEQNHATAKGYARAGIILSIIIGFIYSIIVLIFRKQLINLFNIDDQYVVNSAVVYLAFVTPGIYFSIISKVITGAFLGRGKSSIPFKANIAGLIINIILDPILIFGFGNFKGFGVIGAALATSFAQLVALCILIYYIKVKKLLFDTFQLFKRTEFDKMKDIVKLGIPLFIYNALFTIISMVIAIFIAKYGKEAIAVQKVGSQIESISWMTASGFANAVSAFVGQNVGAKKYDRVYNGYKEAIKISMILGIINTFILFVFSQSLMYIFFTNDLLSQELGISYLKILAVSQIFMCIEITTSGAFNGLGKTKLPSYTNTVLNILRIPLCIVLPIFMGLDGIWWAITISSIFKGLLMIIFFYIFLKKDERFNQYVK